MIEVKKENNKQNRKHGRKQDRNLGAEIKRLE